MNTLLLLAHALMLIVSGGVAAVAFATGLWAVLDVPYPHVGTRLERRGWWKEIASAWSLLIPIIAAGLYGCVMAAHALARAAV